MWLRLGREGMRGELPLCVLNEVGAVKLFRLRRWGCSQARILATGASLQLPAEDIRPNKAVSSSIPATEFAAQHCRPIPFIPRQDSVAAPGDGVDVEELSGPGLQVITEGCVNDGGAVGLQRLQPGHPERLLVRHFHALVVAYHRHPRRDYRKVLLGDSRRLRERGPLAAQFC